jgi:hypothetical protein
VLGGVDGASSLVASVSTTAELLKDWIDVAVANGVRLESRSALVVVVSHFPKLKTGLEVLESRRSADLTEDEANALWTRVRAASDLLASCVPFSVARNPRDGMGVVMVACVVNPFAFV